MKIGFMAPSRKHTIFAILVSMVLTGCASSPGSQEEWITLLDTSSDLENFTTVGSAKWVVTEQGVEAREKGQQYVFLMSRNVYEDFVLRAQFWVSDDANSGIYLRCQDPKNPTDKNCYEANIFDHRPDQTYATGSIVHLAPAPTPAPRAGGRWNTYEIRIQGPRITVNLNGETTVDVEDSQFRQGHIALQWGEGTVKFREVKIKPL